MKISSAGRVSIPVKIRRRLGLKNYDKCNIEIIDGNFVITKFEKNKSSNIGMVRSLNSGARITIPKAYLELLDIKGETEVTMELRNGDSIIIKIK